MEDYWGVSPQQHHQQQLHRQQQRNLASEEAGHHSSSHLSSPPHHNSNSKRTEPLFYCKLVVKHPMKTFAATLTIQLSFMVLTGILQLAGYDILPTMFTDVPLDLNDDDMFLRGEAWVFRDENPSILSRLNPASVVKERTVKGEVIALYYDLEDSGGNVFTPERLASIHKAEDEIQAVKDYDKFCLLDENHECTKPVSIIRFFDGTFKMLNPVFEDSTFSNIPGVLAAAEKYSVTNAILQFHLGRDSVIDASHKEARSSVTRSLLYLGLPLFGYDNQEQMVDEQESKTKDFVMGALRNKLYKLASSGVGDMDFIFNSEILYVNDLNNQVILDLSLAVGSFIFIFTFMWFQTGSLFVASFAILSVLTGFCGANMIYRIVLDYKFFGIFHVLSVFIILGIGADDVFVFFDTWRATAYERYPSLEHRLSDCYRRAAAAMFVTSLTTMIAFFASAMSPLLAVSSFGLFSGLLVFVNYLTVITFLPTVVIVYHLKYESYTLPCFRFCCKGQVAPTDVTKSEPVSTISHADQTDTRKQTSTSSVGRKNIIVRFFAGPYFKVISHKVIKWVVVAVYIIMLSCFVYYATTLEPDEESVKIYKENTNYGRAKVKRLNSFKPSTEDTVIRVFMVWGLRPQDRSKCHKTDFVDCHGQTVWDEAFDMNPAPAQAALMTFCERLRSLSNEEAERLKIRRNVDGELEVLCFMENMEQYLRNVFRILQHNDFRLPVREAEVTRLMSSRPDVYDINGKGDNFYRNFEVAMSYWLSDGYKNQSASMYDVDTFGEMLGESIDQLDTNDIGDFGFYGTRLRYAAIAINTSLPYGNLGFEAGLPIMDKWEEFFTEELEKMPPSLSGGFQCTPDFANSWHWIKVQKVLADSAVTGIILGISLAFPILVIATHNVVLGLMATLTICCITITIVGLIPLAGWKLGVLESLNLSLVVGLAVDYVVHLAEGYHNSPHNDRKGRVQSMLQEVGISVVSGAATTLGASLFMLFAQILFFMQFGIFMFCTIGFSMLYALGLFTAALAIIGPENQTGSTAPLYTAVKNFWTGRSESDVDCKTCEGQGFHKGDNQ